MPKIALRVPLGQPTLSQKINEIKLAKSTKGNQGKQAFLGILDCCLCRQFKALILQNIEIIEQQMKLP